jgi:predicted MPP superfamily phosphohydrolase
MKAQLISDLHTEFYYGDSMDALRRIPFVSDLDFLFLPGDTVVPAHQSAKECRQIFDFLGSKARYVLFTMGNHEYYGSKKGTDVEDFVRSVLPDNYVWLENSEATIEGKHFYGGAMWFPNDPLNQVYENQLNDFRLIKDIHDWVYEKNTEFRVNGNRLIRPDTVVLSHHLPSSLSTHKTYQDSPINRFFVSDETPLILEKKPRLWVHGHTHLSCDYVLGETRVVCSPHGYPAERKWTRYVSADFEI